MKKTINIHKFDEAFKRICSEYCITLAFLRGSRRHRDLNRIRFCIYNCLHKHLNISLVSIAEYFNRHHSSILHGVRVIEYNFDYLCSIDNEFKGVWNCVSDSLLISEEIHLKREETTINNELIAV